MSALPAFKIVELWEKGHNRHPLDRALLLLGEHQSGQSYEHLADWPIGRRDAAVLELRMATFGALFNSYIDCPECRERLEFSFDGRTIQQPYEAQDKIVEFEQWQFRLPTTRDLAKVINEGYPEASAQRLLDLCCLTEKSREKTEWPNTMVQSIETRMSDTDPQANIELDVACEMCGHTWQTVFDVCGFFWEEIEVCAKRLLQDVHSLACAYGWSEQEILALSDRRRQIYLEMVGL
jgi:hypothetical protein